MIRGAGGGGGGGIGDGGALESLARGVCVDKVFELIKVHVEREFDLLLDGLAVGGQGGIGGVVCTPLSVGSLCEVVADALDALARLLFGIAML